MKDKAVSVLVWDTDKQYKNNALKEVLYTPGVEWVLSTLKDLDIKDTVIEGAEKEEVQSIKNLNVKELINWLNEKEQNKVLLLGADCPLIQKKEIEQSYSVWQDSGRKILLFVDAEKYISGAGWFEKQTLVEILSMFKQDADLNDIVEEIKFLELRFKSYPVSNESILPINTAIKNNKVQTRAREIIIEKHLANGIEIPITDGVVIGPEVEIEQGAYIQSSTILKGKTKIAKDCNIGPNTVIENTQIGENSKIIASHLEDAEVGSNSTIGPMSRLRPNSKIGSGVKIGNFVEIKNSAVGDKTAVSHLTYVGDSDVGKGCNIGCGVVTVNYDGKNKNRTVIGDHVFVGCNANLVAPVKLGDEAYVAAGTTITEDIPAKALAIGRSKQSIKENWVEKRDIPKKV